MIEQLEIKDILSALDLEPLPQEGGFFRRSYESSVFVKKENFPQYSGDRRLFTCIYFLLP